MALWLWSARFTSRTKWQLSVLQSLIKDCDPESSENLYLSTPLPGSSNARFRIPPFRGHRGKMGSNLVVLVVVVVVVVVLHTDSQHTPPDGDCRWPWPLTFVCPPTNRGCIRDNKKCPPPQKKKKKKQKRNYWCNIAATTHRIGLWLRDLSAEVCVHEPHMAVMECCGPLHSIMWHVCLFYCVWQWPSIGVILFHQ